MVHSGFLVGLVGDGDSFFLLIHGSKGVMDCTVGTCFNCPLGNLFLWVASKGWDWVGVSYL